MAPTISDEVTIVLRAGSKERQSPDLKIKRVAAVSMFGQSHEFISAGTHFMAYDDPSGTVKTKGRCVPENIRPPG